MKYIKLWENFDNNSNIIESNEYLTIVKENNGIMLRISEEGKNFLMEHRFRKFALQTKKPILLWLSILK